MLSRHNILLFSLLLFFSINDLLAQRGAYTFRGSKSSALAGISSTLRSPDAIFNNPANLALIDSKYGLIIGSQNRFLLSDITTAQIGGYYEISDNNIISLSLSKYGFSEYREQKISAAFSRKLMDNLSLSANFDYNQIIISEHGQTSYLSYGLGIAGKFNKRIGYGAYIFNFQNEEIANSSESNAFIQIGIFNKVTDKLTIHGEVEKYIEEKLNVKLGVEYKMHALVAIRLGYYTDPGAFSFGFSYTLASFLQIDMAAQYDILLGMSPSISLQYRGPK